MNFIIKRGFTPRLGGKRPAVLLFVLLLLFAGSMVPMVKGDIWDHYHEKDELIGMFKTLCDAHPSQASYESVGKSYLGEDIWMFSIGNPYGGKVLWDGQLHGSEDIGSEAIYLIAEWLLESRDPKAEQILDQNLVLFIPIVNMDSYVRATRNYEDCRYGVDLNRNFRTGWSRSTCSSSETYSGPSAASEPETQVMRSVFQNYRPEFYVNLHCGAGPYISYYRGSDYSVARQVENRMDELSSEMGITPYRVSTMGSNGFAIGDAASFGIHSWLVELRDSIAWRHTDELYQEFVDVYFPKVLAFFISMAEACAVTTSPAKDRLWVFEVPLGDTTISVAIKSNSTISDFSFSQPEKKIAFDVIGNYQTTGHCNVTIPRGFLEGEFAVLKDGISLREGEDYILSENVTHHTFDLNYIHSTHEIAIVGTQVIPEFPYYPSIILVAMAFTLLMILLKRKLQLSDPACAS